MASQPREPSNQSALWNGAGGGGWVALQGVLDQLLQPIEDLLVDAIASATTGRVLDVGCGTGSTTVAAERRIGTKACVCASATMKLAAAPARSARARAAEIIGSDTSTPVDVFGTEQRPLLVDQHGQLEGRVTAVRARIEGRDVEHGPKLVRHPQLERKNPRDSRKMRAAAPHELDGCRRGHG